MLYLLAIALLALVTPAPTTASRSFKDALIYNEKKPCECLQVFDPVCVNRLRYSNKCFAKCGRTHAIGTCAIMEGAAPICLCPTIYKPVCVNGGWYANECIAKCGRPTGPCPVMEGAAPAPEDEEPDDKQPDDKEPDDKEPDDKEPDDKEPDDKGPDDKEPVKKPFFPNPPRCGMVCTNSYPRRCSCIKGSKPGCTCKGFEFPKKSPLPWKQ